MTNLFKKAVVFGDLHLGLKSNSEVHNTDCIEFMTWMVKKALEEGCDTCIFVGDYHNNRNTMNLRTMSYAVQGLELLSKNFKQTFFIPGNHDLFFKDQRTVHSVDWAKHVPNITIINDWFVQGNVIIAPWLVGSDYKEIKQLQGKYMFGHFELPGYMMNAMVRMPDHGDISVSDLSHIEHCFSGHFHKRQTMNNVTYIGNAFPHNYADAGDDERGIMVLEWDKQPEFFAWPNQPTFRTVTLSQLINNTESIVKPNQYLRVQLDIELPFDQAAIIKEKFIEDYQLREFILIPDKSHFDINPDNTNTTFESVDEIVSNQITNIQSDSFDSNILLNIYYNL